MTTVNEEQSSAAALQLLDRGALLIVGGPGSGKTQTMAHRCAQLVERGVAPDRIMVLTFTRAAAASMHRRVRLMVGPAADDILTGTFHSVAHLVFQTYEPEREYTLMDDKTSDLLMERAAQTCFPGMAKYGFSSLLDSVRRQMQQPPLAVLEQQVADVYGALKREGAYWGFDDLLREWLAYLRSPSSAAFREQIQYVLIDEVQDLDEVQYSLIDEMYRSCIGLTAIGDDAQSIYGFRGVSVQELQRFEERYHPARSVQLRRNYRNPPHIVEAARRVLERNQHQRQRQHQRSPQPGYQLPLVWLWLTCGQRARGSRSSPSASRASPIASFSPS